MSNPFSDPAYGLDAEEKPAANPFSDPDYGTEQGVIGTLKSGAMSAGRAIGSTADTYLGDNQGVVDKAKTNSEATRDYRLDNFYQDFAENTGQGTDQEAGLWGSIKGAGKAVIDNPAGAGLAVVEQLPNSAPALAGGWAGMKAGAAAGGAIGLAAGGIGAGPGAVVGGIVGGVAGMFLGNTLIETGHKAMEAAGDGEFADAERSQVMREGAVKSGVITGVDALTLGIGGKVSQAMRRTTEQAVEVATRKALTDAGVDITSEAAIRAARDTPEIAKAVTDAQKNAARLTDTLRRRGVEAGTLLSMETVGEGLGEYLGELAATGEASIPDAVLESILSLGQSGLETAWNMSRTRAPQDVQIQPMPTAENPSPAPVDRPDPSAGPLSAAANLLPAPARAGALPAPDTVFVDGQGEASRDGVNKNVDGEQRRAQQGQAWVNPANDPMQAGGPGMDRQAPRGEGAPLTGDLIRGGGQGGSNPDRTNRVIEGEVVGRDAGLPAPGRRLADQREQGFTVDADGNAQPGPLSTQRPDDYTQGGAGMDRQTLRGAAPQPQTATDSKGNVRPVVRLLPDMRDEGFAVDSEGNAQSARLPSARPENYIHGGAGMDQPTPRDSRFGNIVQAKRAIQQADAPETLEAVKIGPKEFAVQTKPEARPILQNRDRSTAASVTQMRKIASNPDYGRVSISRDFANGAPVVEDGAAVPAARLGRKDTAVTASGRKIPFQYAAMEADELLASHDIQGFSIPDYAEGLPGKSRAIAGNGRVTGVQHAYTKGAAGQYRADLQSDDQHGISRIAIAGMRNPVLVRVMPSEFITQDIGDESNTAATAGLSPIEQARNDLERVNLDDFQFTQSGEISRDALRQFVRTMPDAERATMLDGNDAGKGAIDRFQAMLFVAAYDDNALLQIQAQSADPESVTLIKGMLLAAPKMARLRDAGAWDIRPLVAEAAGMIITARRNQRPLDEYRKQIDLARSPDAQAFIDMMVENISSPRKIAEALGNAADAFYGEASRPETDMFGVVPRRSRADLMGVLNDEQGTSADTQGTGNTAGPADAQGSDGRQAVDRGRQAGDGADSSGRRGFDLEQQTEQSLSEHSAARVEAEAREAAQRKAEADRAQADRDRNDFNLTGSDRSADVAAAAGQNDMFAPPTRGQKKAEQAAASPEAVTATPAPGERQSQPATASAADLLAAISDDDLSALIDDVAGEVNAAETSKPATKRKTKGKTASGKPRLKPKLSPAESKPAASDRAASEIAKSMGVNMSSAGLNALRGLEQLFGGKGRLGSGLNFDEETYAKAKPLFKAALDDVVAAGKDLRDFIKALLGRYGDGVKPYILRFAQDLKQEQASNERTGQNLESDSTADAEQGAGANTRDDQPGEAGRGSGQLGQGEGGRRAGNDDGISNGSPAAGGKRGYPGMDGAQPGLEGSDAGGADTRGGRPDSTGGLYAERESDPAADRATAQPLKAHAKASVKPSSKPGTLEEIKAQMPFLTHGQAQDVVFAEKRLSQPEGYGVLYTNGTGTGKTFSGLGIAARSAANGKDSILILAPKQTIVDAWVKAAAGYFNLPAKVLESTADNGGSGVVVTTYANLSANPTLADRDWDMIIADEAHYLSSAEDGKSTAASRNLRALAGRRGSGRNLVHMREREKVQRMDYLRNTIRDETRAARDAGGNYISTLDKPIAELERELYALDKELHAKTEAQEAANKAKAPIDKTRAVFLSATPFAYEKNVMWAQEFLFDWGDGEQDMARGYNSGSDFDRFMMQHFGYRMRYNKLTEPDAKVDRGLMQRAFNSWLKKEGVLSGRALESDFDYDRLFVTVESPIGKRVDEALKWLRDMSRTKDDNGVIQHASEEVQKAFRDLHDGIVKGSFDYHSRMYFLEAIKASEAVPHIKAQLAAGRKVLVMHDFKKGGTVNPFRVRFAEPEIEAANQVFRAAFPDLLRAFDALPSPIDQLSRSFPGAMVYNGSVSAKNRIKLQDQFNSDDDGSPRLMIAQGDAMREGVSIHDTTGKFPRALVHLGMPVKPTAAIQQEGRIYRTGQGSNAMFRYFTIGTAWERTAFASKIATRASAAENLAMGEQARGLKQAFIEAYENADLFEPGFEGEGIGGKGADIAAAQALTPWDSAKSYYFGTKKQGKGRSARGREGTDYFATPEPVGLKMVEWADIRGGESALEPSAGHGAIARWFPDSAKVRVIEQSGELASRVALHVDGDVVHGSFEDHHIVNKYDAIVMNPPYGLGGAVAIPHLAKATDHLREGGRVVALIPTGPAADKRFENWLYGQDKSGNSLLPNLHLIADVKMPAVTFERAGTSTATRVVIIEKVAKDQADSLMPTRSVDLTRIESIGELFDRMESMEMPARIQPVTTEQTAPVKSVTDSAANAGAVEQWEAKHSKTGAQLFMAKPGARLDRDEYKRVADIATQHNGYWSRFGKPGFLFSSEQDRAAFVSALGGDTPVFSRRTSGAARSFLSRGAVEKIAIGQVGKAAAGRFVFTSYAGLPDAIKQAAQSQGAAPGEIRAVHWQGKTYLVDGRFRSARDVRRAVFHEHYVHFGLRAKYGSGVNLKMMVLLKQVGGLQGALTMASQQGIELGDYVDGVIGNPDIPRPQQGAIIMEELLAHMGEATGTLRRMLQEALGAIRNWLRKNGWAELAKLNATDMAHLLREARQAAIASDRQPASAVTFAPSQADYTDQNIEEYLSGYGNERETGDLQVRQSDSGSIPQQGMLDLYLPADVPGEVARQQAADSFNIRYEQVATGGLRSGFDSVTTPEQVAHLIAPIRKYAQEMVMAVMTDRDGKVLSVIHHSKGDKSSSNVNLVELVGAMAATKGASKVWLAHHHPSGNPERSGADENITRRVRDTLDGSGIELQGHVIVAPGGKAEYFSAGADIYGYGINVTPARRLKNIPITERVLRKRKQLGSAIQSPDDARALVARTEARDAILLLSTKHSPLGAIVMTPEEMKTLREGGRVRRILSAMATTNADAVIIKTADREAAENVARFLNNANARVLDWITPDGISSADNGMGVQSSHGPFFSRAPQVDTKAFRQWFGDSKAVDSAGQPLILHHGTAAEFTVFDQLRSGTATGHATSPLGIFLTADRNMADSYALKASDGMPGLARVMDLYAEIRKPYRMSIEESQSLDTAAKALARRAELERQGYDGIRLKGTAVWIVFNNYQVKSATHNTGAFDPFEADIRFSRSGHDAATQEALDKLGLGGRDAAGLADKIRNATAADLKELMGSWSKRSEEGLFDGLSGIRRAEEAAGITDPDQQGYVSARMATGIADVMHGVLHYAAPEWRDGVISGKAGTRGVLEILGDLGADDLNAWLGWLGGKRGQLLKVQGRENNLTDADIAELLAMGKGKEAKFEQVYQEYAKVNEAVLDLAEQAGLIDKETRAKWATDYYVPFYRQQEGTEGLYSAPRTKRGLSHQTAAIRALKGGTLPTNDLLTNMLAGWTKRIDAAMKNKALLEVVDNLQGSDFLSDESMRYQQVLISRSQIAAQIRKDRKALKMVASMLGMKEGANAIQVASELMKPQNEGFEKVWTQVAPTDPDIIRVQRGGRNEYYRVNDESLLRGLKFMEGSVFNDPVTRIGRTFKRLLTTGVTASPDFILRNFIRDAAHAWMINKDGFSLGGDSIRGMRDALREDQDYRDLMFAGGSFQGGYVHGNDPEAAAQIIRRALEKKGFTRQQQDGYLSSLANTPAKVASMLGQGWQMYRGLGDKVENANRLATYKAALAAGKSRRQASYEAKDLMDYSLRGNFAAAQWLTDVVPFLNARMQGLYKLGRAMKGDKALIAKEVAMKGGYIALFSLLLAGINDDDERYQALQDWDKDMHWHIFLGDKHFRIPKPFELGLLFGTVPERMLHAATGSQDGGDLSKAVAHGVFQTLAFNPVPQFYQPIRELQANRNFFRDSPIEDMSDEGKVSAARYDERTSALGKAVGQLTGPLAGLSPKQIDHLVMGYTGTLGGYVLSISSLLADTFSEGQAPAARAGDIPVLKVLYQGEAVRSTKYQSEFYDMMREADQLHRTIKSYQEEGRIELAETMLKQNADKIRSRPVLGLARKQLGTLRNQMDAVHRDKAMSSTDKRERLDMLQRKANEVAERAVRMMGERF